MGAVACFVLYSPTIDTTNDAATSFAGVFLTTNIDFSQLTVTSTETSVVGEPSEVEIQQEKLGAENYVESIVTIPSYSGFKSFESYKAISDGSSNQAKLQRYCYTSKLGIRTINDRYLVAVGTGVGAEVGRYINLVLENGTKIACVVGDIKDDSHTDSSNLITVHSDCASEFIVDINALESYVQNQGDISYAQSGWDSPVNYIEVLNNNIFYEIEE